VDSGADLPHIITTGCFVGGFANLLNRRDQESDQDGDDGDDHQQLDQSESGSLSHGFPPQP
jgi:hypothetical protein